MESSHSQIDKTYRRCPQKVGLPHVNINTGEQNINREIASSSQLYLSETTWKYYECNWWAIFSWELAPQEIRNFLETRLNTKPH